MYHDGLITTADISCQTDSQTAEARSPSFPPFLSVSDEEERMIHGGSVKTTEEELRNKTFRKRWQRLLLHEGFCLFINGEGAKPILIQVLDPRKARSHPESLINQRSTMSTVAPPQSLSSWYQNLKGRQLLIFRSQINRHTSSQPAVQSSHQSKLYTLMNQIFTCIDFQKNSEVLKGSYQLHSSDSPPTTPTIEKAGASVVVKFWPSSRVTRVPPHQRHLKRTTNLTYQLTHCRSKKIASGLAPSPHSTRGPTQTSTNAMSLSDYIYSGSFTRIFDSGGTIPLVGGLDLTARVLREDSRLHAGYCSATGFSNSRSLLRC